MVNNKKKLEKAVNAIVTRLEKAENFVLEQAPDVCKEVIAEKKALGQLTIGVSIFIIMLLITLGLIANHNIDHTYSLGSNENCGPMVLIGLSVMLIVVCLGFIIDTSVRLISLKVAPKLNILRELKSLVEGE